MATPAKAKAEKPVPREALRGCHAGEEFNTIQRLELDGERLTAQKLTQAKAGVEKPVRRRAPKRRHPGDSSDEDLGCSSPKIPRLELEDNRLTPQNLTPANVGKEKPVPRRSLKRHHSGENSDQVLGCSSPKIQRLEQDGETLMPQKLTPAKTYAEKPVRRGTLNKRRSSWVKL